VNIQSLTGTIHKVLDARAKEIIEQEALIASERVKERVQELAADIAFEVSSRDEMSTMTTRLEVHIKMPDGKSIQI